jgi:hypothetical protein
MRRSTSARYASLPPRGGVCDLEWEFALFADSLEELRKGLTRTRVLAVGR